MSQLCIREQTTRLTTNNNTPVKGLSQGVRERIKGLSQGVRERIGNK
jgi:hypothetical protein